MQNKINEKRAFLVETNKTRNEFFFTSDDQGFYTQDNANAHAGKLKDKEVVSITRAEVAEWRATDKPARLAEAKSELEAANADLAAAEKDKAALGGKADVKAQREVNAAVNKAKLRVAAAQVEVDKYESAGAESGSGDAAGGAKANLGLLKGAITRAQNALAKVDPNDTAAVADAQAKVDAAKKAYTDAGGVLEAASA